MFTFLKKIFGLPTDEEIAAAKYSTPAVNNKTGELVFPPTVTAVNDQITDSVTQEVAPAKKPRKPRTPKTKVEGKAAKPVKAAAMKLASKRSKKA